MGLLQRDDMKLLRAVIMTRDGGALVLCSVNSAGRVLSLQVRSHWFESNTEYLFFDFLKKLLYNIYKERCKQQFILKMI